MTALHSTTRSRRILPTALALAAFATVLAGCGDDEEQAAPADGGVTIEELSAAAASALDATTQFVGTLDGDAGVYVGVEIVGASARVYICDGSSVGEWYTGTVDGDSITATSDDGATVTATVAGGTVTGTATLPDGSEQAFTVTDEPLPAGLYELALVENGEVVSAATVILPDGTAKGLFGKGKKLEAKCNSIRTAYQQNAASLMVAEEEGLDRFEIMASMSTQFDNYYTKGCDKFGPISG